ncbi:hypothetical protein [Streptomyces sp. HB132]|uniref:hypothetical protein n=1 Tax=Streptomyces sp. HB132 TaxID=767388 RepID=UPI00195F853B|nr:hypothetical protein [Streptomyces sp. HB132]MBM7442238.1 hypothetical protein [Streptomyces sp. HB132]
MSGDGTTVWEVAVLAGGPADGLRMRVADRPGVVQVTSPCELDGPPPGVRVDALYVYRREPQPRGGLLRYGFDAASP